MTKTEIQYRDDMFVGEEHHPQCCFFEAFPSSPDPYETFFGAWFCHMSCDEKEAEICKGDYLNCPLAYGKTVSGLLEEESSFDKCPLCGAVHDPLECCF